MGKMNGFLIPELKIAGSIWKPDKFAGRWTSVFFRDFI